MGSFSIWHILLVLLVVLVVFGGGKLPRLMGDFAKGIKAFKSGMKDIDAPPATPASDPANGRIADTTTSSNEKV